MTQPCGNSLRLVACCQLSESSYNTDTQTIPCYFEKSLAADLFRATTFGVMMMNPNRRDKANGGGQHAEGDDIDATVESDKTATAARRVKETEPTSDSEDASASNEELSYNPS